MLVEYVEAPGLMFAGGAAVFWGWIHVGLRQPTAAHTVAGVWRHSHLLPLFLSFSNFTLQPTY